MNATAENNNVLPMSEQGIVAYNEFRAQLAELKAVNDKTIFQYSDPKGNKACRSYLHKLRLTKGEVERVRKQEKASSLEYGRRVDAGAKEITSEIESMIAVHEVPLLEIENKEKERVAAIKARIDRIKAMQEATGLDSKETAHNLERLRAVVVDDSFAEFQEEARQEIDKSIAAQEAQNIIAVKGEQEAAELARLRAEDEARKQAEREAQIAAEATARAEAAAKAEAEEVAIRVAAEAEVAARREQEAKERADKAEEEARAAEQRQIIMLKQAELDKASAAKKAQEDKAAAVEAAAKAEQDKLTAAQDAERKATEAREADKKHKARINREALQAIVDEALTISPDDAKKIVELIAQGKIPHVKIIY
jgi:hypothetical protein